MNAVSVCIRQYKGENEFSPGRNRRSLGQSSLKNIASGLAFWTDFNGLSDIFPLAIHTGGLAAALAGALDQPAFNRRRLNAEI